MKVIVGFPPTPTEKGTPLLSQNRQFQYFDNPTFLFPVALGTGATMLRDLGHYDVLWEDAIAQQDSEESYFAMLAREKPDFYFFETKAPVVKAHWAAITRMKQRFPKMKIIICGDHVTFAPRETMENSPVDYLVCGGYYDFAALELIQALEKGKAVPQGVWYRKNGKIVENGRYELKRPLDDAPIIDRKLTKNDLYQKEFNLKGRPLAYIMSGRDCWYGKCTFCFHPSTNVLTENGIKEIKDVQLGEKILTHDGTYSETNMVFKRPYAGKLVKIKPSNLPEEVICTPNHKLFAVKKGASEPKFIEASDLEERDSLTFPVLNEIIDVKELDIAGIIANSFAEIVTNVKTIPVQTSQSILLLKDDGLSERAIARELKINRETVRSYLRNEPKGKISLAKSNGSISFTNSRKSIPDKIALNSSFMRLAGYYLAEGSSSFSSYRRNSGTLQFTFNKNETMYINDVKDLLRNLFNLDAALVENKANNTIQVTVYSNVLAYLFKELFGNSSYTKNMPQMFMKLPVEKQQELLKGLFRGDAHLRKDKSEYILNTVSKQMAYKVWVMLTRMGIVPSFYISNKENDAKANYNQFVLSVCASDMGKLGFAVSEISHPGKSHRNVKVQDGMVHFKITKISNEDFNGFVYNMSVPGNHTYTANLVSVSNCVWDQTLYPKGNFRVRTPENVMKEVKYLVDECGVKEIFDDCGTITVGKWLQDFCKLMIDSGYNKKVMYSCNMRFGAVNADEYKLMHKAGFRLLKYGLESGNQFTIDKLDKGTKIPEVVKSCREAKEAGLIVHLTMMVGYPWETRKDAMETIKLSKYLMRKGYADVLQSTVIVPYPGTPLWREGMEKNWFRFNPHDYERFDMAEPVFKTPDMSPQEVLAICRKIYNVFWHPEYIFRHLMKIKSMEDVKYTLKGVRAVVGHMFDFSREVKEE